MALSVLCSLLCTMALYGQERVISGKVVDSSGEGIEYVSMGVAGTNFSGISDAGGNFSLRIPEYVLDKDLVFAHLSYNEMSIPADSLISAYNAAAARGGTFLITLEQRQLNIAPITVTAGRLRTKNLNSVGVILRSFGAYHIRPWPYRNQPPTGGAEGINNGYIMEFERSTWITQLELTVLHNSFDSMVFRFVAYRIEDDGSYTPLMHSPHYLNLEKAYRSKTYKWDVSELNIYSSGQVYIGIDMVYDSDRGEIKMPVYNQPSYYRNMATGIMHKESHSIGLKIRGAEL